jgi:repressor LexA
VRLAGVRKAILIFITAYTEQHGFPPSVREIGKAVGLTSTASVHYHLSKLQVEGYLTKNTAGPRTVVVAKNVQES